MTGATLRGAVVARPDGVARGPLHLAGGRVVADAPSGAIDVDLAGHAILPGLINAHEHLPINAVPPLPRGAPFPNSYEWAKAFQAHFAEPAVAAALAVPAEVRHWHGGLKNLLAGATTVAHHDPWHAALDDPDFPVAVLQRFGWCHSLGMAPSDGALAGIARAVQRLVPSLTRKFGERLVPSLSRPRLGPFGPPLEGSFAATPRGAPWIIHLAEGTDAVAGAELGELEARGCLDGRTVIVHGVALGEVGVARVIARGAGVVWCPSSNRALYGRTLEPRALLAVGRLALGTDSRLSGGRDLLDELRVAAGYGPSSADLVELVTGGAARVLAISDAGTLAAGARADLVVVRAGGADPATALVAARRADLRAVVRDGLPAVGDPDLAEWFSAAGVDTVAITVDGHPKLLARRFARVDAMAQEPGLTFAA